MKKLSKTFLQQLPVPERHIVKSFKAVTIPDLYVENSHTRRFPINLRFKPAMSWKF